jgi:hypothetical protein
MDEKKKIKRKFHELAETKMTPEIKRDLKIIKMRNFLDPKRFYKSADSKTLPTKFEVRNLNTCILRLVITKWFLLLE